jgi:hypothetical protein
MTGFRTLAVGSALAATIAGCSIENTQPLGSPCVMTRECVGYLDGGVACLPNSSGNYLCEPYTGIVLDAAVVTDALPIDAAGDGPRVQ